MADNLKTNFRSDKVIKNIQRMVDQANDLRPVLLQIQGTTGSTNPNTIIGGINKQFIGQGGYFGPAWKALSHNYAHAKVRQYGYKTILRRSDKLYRSVTVQGAPGNVQILEWTRLVWGLTDDVIPYAKFHMTGTKYMKARKFMGITAGQKQLWTKLIASYITEVKEAQK
jgi:hypothetical protein